MNYDVLALAIIMQAVDDYRECRRNHISTTALENFFKGSWCAFLLGNMKVTGEDILLVLESE